MNREKAKELADVLTAYANGADLQYEARNEWTDDLKAEIIRLCNADKLDELKTLIEENLK